MKKQTKYLNYLWFTPAVIGFCWVFIEFPGEPRIALSVIAVAILTTVGIIKLMDL
jgi:hypothetical protein